MDYIYETILQMLALGPVLLACDLYSGQVNVWVKMADENAAKETCTDIKNTTPSTNIPGLADSVKPQIEDTELDELLDSTCCVLALVPIKQKVTRLIVIVQLFVKVCQFDFTVPATALNQTRA